MSRIVRSTDLRGALRARQRGFLLNPFRFGVSGGGADPYFSSVVLGMNMDGDDADTDTTDFSAGAHTFTFNGNAQIDTTGGTQSLLLDGTGDEVIINGSGSDFQFGTGDFAVEVWIVTSSASGGLFVQPENGTGWAMFFFGGDVYWQSRYNNTNLMNRSVIASGTSIVNGTLAHVAFARSGTDNRMFHRGIQVGATVTSAEDYESTTAPNIGSVAAVGTFLAGNVLAARVTKGSARGYTENFTPPVPPLPTS